jgi:hypothetical protein
MNIRKKIREALAKTCTRRVVDGEESDIWETEPNSDKNHVLELLQNVIVLRYETLDENKKPRLIHKDIFTFEQFESFGGFAKLEEIAELKQATKEKTEIGKELIEPQKEQKQKGSKRL